MDRIRFYSQFFPDKKVERDKRLRFFQEVFRNAGLLRELDDLIDIRGDVDRILSQSQDFNTGEVESLIEKLDSVPESAERNLYRHQLINLYQDRTGLEY